MRRVKLTIKRARGFLLVVAVLVVAVVALAITALGYMTSADVRSSTQHAQSEQAYFAAGSGLEYAAYQFGAGTACAGLTNTNISVGNGTFTTSATLYVPARTTLSAAITAASTTIPVASIAGYAPTGQVRVDNEDITYAGTSALAATCNPAAAPCLLNAQRGASGSTAAAHAVIANQVSQGMCVVTSTGTVGGAGGATRVLQRGLRLPGAMFVYAKLNLDRVPYYRRWDGTAWGAELTATNVGGAGSINFMVLKFARTRNEAILGVQNSAGVITVQIWNGSTWSAVTTVGTTPSIGFRSFDIEYERNSDRALIAYYNNVANQFSYRTWNGTILSGATNQALPAVGVTPIRWLEMAANPLATSNEIAMITTNNSGAASGNIYGLRWTGSAWDNMGVAVLWDTAAGSTATKIIDVAYEQLSGDILFIWGGAARVSRYRTYSGGVLSGNLPLTINENTGTPNWVRLAPDPTSNRIMFAAIDTANSGLNTRVWSGAAWDCNGGAAGTCVPHPEHDAAIEDIADRNFDIVFETHPLNPGIAWLVWGNGATVSRRRWNSSTASWAAITTTPGDDTAYVHLLAHPFKDSGAVFAGIYEDSTSATDDITAMQLTAGGSVWPATFQVWNGGAVANPVQNRIFLDSEEALVTIYGLEAYP